MDVFMQIYVVYRNVQATLNMFMQLCLVYKYAIHGNVCAISYMMGMFMLLLLHRSLQHRVNSPLKSESLWLSLDELE